MIALDRTPNIIRFATLAGVASASIDGQSIVGIWKPTLTWRSQPKKRGTAAEDFASWPNSDEAILRYTKRYGPLDARPTGGKQFRFSMDRWRDDQEGIRILWAMVNFGADSGSVGKFENGIFKPSFTSEARDRWSMPTEEGDSFSFDRGQLVYRNSTLLRFLMLDLLSVPREYLRICKREDCSTRCFVAEHLREDFCSPECKQWAQRLWKRNWWNEKGTTRRKGGK